MNEPGKRHEAIVSLRIVRLEGRNLQADEQFAAAQHTSIALQEEILRTGWTPWLSNSRPRNPSWRTGGGGCR